MAYQPAHKPDRLKALAGVLVVHVALGAVILSGLNVRTVERTIERLKAFDIREAPPPPPPPPPPAPDRASKEEGAAGRKAVPTPVVAPPPKIVLPAKPPVAAAPVPSTGSASTAGAATAGSGTGAGGSGTGLGGGGRGSGSGSGEGFTPARRISKIPDREYRRFVAASGMRRGSVGITVKVNTDGRLSNCRIVRSSGNQSVDQLMCSLTLQYVRFRPARDPQGRPVAQDISWYPDWSPNR